ncbi:FAM10 family protein At4g22670-like [Salvia splendens]|uniref:FAM10 family protein At4g22670-like n=1 Tax=Salvia splendens TaxID=180675 RepID=UPI001C254E4E|nr:FAM10 family protein At4g22670-like [Salvia splendens]
MGVGENTGNMGGWENAGGMVSNMGGGMGGMPRLFRGNMGGGMGSMPGFFGGFPWGFGGFPSMGGMVGGGGNAGAADDPTAPIIDLIGDDIFLLDE